MKYLSKNKSLREIFLVIIVIPILSSFCVAQSSSAGFSNVDQSGMDFLGWDNTVNSTLEIRHDTPGEPIIFGTSNLERMRIKPDARISINTTSSLGGTRFAVLQDIPSSRAVNAEVRFFDPNNPEAFAAGLFSNVGSATNRNTAIFGECDGLSKQEDIALQGISEGGVLSIGVRGSVDGNGNWTQGGPPMGDWAGMFFGDVTIIGTFGTSDQNLKQNIEPLESARASLLELRPVSFHFSPHPDLPFNEEIQFGFIAQEVQAVLPELVREIKIPDFIEDEIEDTGEGHVYLGLNSTGLIPVLVKGLQEHDDLLTENEDKLNELNQTLAAIQSQISNLNTQENE